MKFGTITPTDIDGLIEYHNKYFIFIETKYKTGEVPHGQKLALERLCDATQRSGKPSLLMICTHESKGDIDVGETIVSEYRYKYCWKIPNKTVTAFRMVKGFIEKMEGVDGKF